MKRTSATKVPPVVKQFANLWTLQHYPSKEKEWSGDRKFAEARKAGFTAMGGGADKGNEVLAQKYGLDYICYTDADGHNFKEKLERCHAMSPARVNVQLCDHDTPPKEAAAVWIKLEAQARKLGLAVDLEVHRDTCTETPEKTYEIAALYQKKTGRKIDFSWDFSHLCVVKHLYPPYADRLLVQPDLVQRARQFHFRPFNGHHAQIPATDGRGHATPEFNQWLAFAGDLLDIWLAGARGGETIYICPELGPPSSGYALSNFPDAWKDAIFTREKVAELWESKLKTFAAKR